MTAYYNDIEPYALEVIGRRIAAGDLPDGTLDSRSITEITAVDIGDADEAHLFAGMGGWPLALRMAEYDGPYPVWTGSCPCQPFSSAGKRRGTDDDRDLWDDFVRLIREGRPPAVFGEQVASSETVGTQLEADFALAVRSGRFAQANKLAHRLARSKSLHWHQRWISRVHADLAAEGYAMRFDVLGAHSVESPHIRQRIFFGAVRLADSDGEGSSRLGSEAGNTRRPAVESVRQVNHGLADSDDGRCKERREQHGREIARISASRGHNDDRRGAGDHGLGDTAIRRDRTDAVGRRDYAGANQGREQRRRGPGAADYRLGDTIGPRPQGHAGNGDDRHQPGRLDQTPTGSVAAPDWNDQPCILVECREPGRDRPVYRRAPAEPALFPVAHGLPGRVARLKVIGNAIVPQVAAEFVRAFMASVNGRDSDE